MYSRLLYDVCMSIKIDNVYFYATPHAVMGSCIPDLYVYMVCRPRHPELAKPGGMPSHIARTLSLVLDIHSELGLCLHLIPLFPLFSGIFGSCGLDIVEHRCVGPLDSFGCPVEVAVLNVSANTATSQETET